MDTCTYVRFAPICVYDHFIISIENDFKGNWNSLQLAKFSHRLEGEPSEEAKVNKYPLCN